MTLLELLEPLAELLEPRIVHVLAQAARDLDLDLLGLLARVRSAEDRLEQVGVEDERLEIVANRIDVDVLVDQLDRLRPEDVPERACRCPVDGLTDS